MTKVSEGQGREEERGKNGQATGRIEKRKEGKKGNNDPRALEHQQAQLHKEYDKGQVCRLRNDHR